MEVGGGVGGGAWRHLPFRGAAHHPPLPLCPLRVSSRPASLPMCPCNPCVQVGGTCARATILAVACSQAEAGLVSAEVPDQNINKDCACLAVACDMRLFELWNPMRPMPSWLCWQGLKQRYTCVGPIGGCYLCEKTSVSYTGGLGGRAIGWDGVIVDDGTGWLAGWIRFDWTAGVLGCL